MPKPNRLKTDVYAEIMGLLLKGVNNQPTIIKELKSRKIRLTEQELRNKISWLNKKDFIKIELKYPGRGSRAKYKVNGSRLIEYILDNFLIKIKTNRERIINDEKLKKSIELFLVEYFEHQKSDWEMNQSLHELLEKFVLSIGSMAHYDVFFNEKKKLKIIPFHCMAYYVVNRRDYVMRIAEGQYHRF